MRRRPTVPAALTGRLPRVPRARVLWSRGLVVAFLLLGLFLLDRLTLLIANFWFLQSVGLESVFWTNFKTGAALFVAGFVAFTAAVATPAVVHRVDPSVRRLFVAVGIFVGLIAGYMLSLRFADYLLLLSGQAFGETDPVFGRDIGFYAFTLPPLWTTWTATLWCLLFALVSSAASARLARSAVDAAPGVGPFGTLIGVLCSRFTLGILALLGILAAAGVRLSRYGLLLKDNGDSAVYTGAAYLDVTGLFSTLNYIHVTSLGALGLTVGIVVLLHRVRRAALGDVALGDWRRPIRRAGVLVLVPVVMDFAFKAVVSLRDLTAVVPNEPVIQLEFIKRHIDATLGA